MVDFFGYTFIFAFISLLVFGTLAIDLPQNQNQSLNPTPQPPTPKHHHSSLISSLLLSHVHLEWCDKIKLSNQLLSPEHSCRSRACTSTMCRCVCGRERESERVCV